MQLRIGNKMVGAEMNDAGVPVIKCWSEETKHADGRVDVTIHVPCLQIQAKKE